MKTFQKILLLSAVVTLVACGGAPEVPAITDIEITESTMTGDVAKTVANIKIEGMMCENACVGKVSKELNGMDCVSVAEIDFDLERDVDIAQVEFDPATCSPESMINTIHGIGGGLYIVKGVEVVTYEVEI